MVRQSLELLATWIAMMKFADFIFDDHDFSLLKGTAAQCTRLNSFQVTKKSVVQRLLGGGC